MGVASHPPVEPSVLLKAFRSYDHMAHNNGRPFGAIN